MRLLDASLGGVSEYCSRNTIGVEIEDAARAITAILKLAWRSFIRFPELPLNLGDSRADLQTMFHSPPRLGDIGFPKQALGRASADKQNLQDKPVVLKGSNLVLRTRAIRVGN